MLFFEYLSGLVGKKVAVVGAGVSNLPLIERLLEAGVSTTIRDKRSRSEMEAVAERFERLGARLCLGAGYLDSIDEDLIFRTPGIMPWNPAFEAAVQRGAVLTSEMEVFFDVCPCKIIAVTGSDGKTTTTSIIAELLRRQGLTVHLGGNIGNPLLCGADAMGSDDIAVLELSSFQLITMRKSPNIAVITNISPNHLDVHRDYDEYVNAKRNIFLHQSSADIVILNYDNEITRGFARETRSEVRFFSRRARVDNGVYYENGAISEVSSIQGGTIIRTDEIRLPGTHNVENYMAAFAAVSGLVGYDAMRATARTFQGVRHRLELVSERQGVKYINDSIATTPTRTTAGLKAFDRKVILIAGGYDKGLDFTQLGVEICEYVKTLILTGHTAGRIRDAVINAPGTVDKPDIFTYDNFEDAVKAASEKAKDGDIVLLSPACASFDSFSNFEERGEAFGRIVDQLGTRD